MRKPLLLCSLVVLAAASVQARPRTLDYALILDEAPARSKSSSRMARVESSQNALAAELARRQFRVAGSVQLLVNAVFVKATREQVAELRSLPGVARVVQVPRARKALFAAADLVNASGAWSAVGGVGNAGAGVKIGVVDSGIDITHPGMQDPAMQAPAGFPKGDAAYTNGKVIVARSYLGAVYEVIPLDVYPDDDSPRDFSGHGTAIAMIAAGARHASPRGDITGIAPKAWLGNYKIFGTPGLNDTAPGLAVLEALEDAVADGMNIVILPFTFDATYGPLDTGCEFDEATGTSVCDIFAQAAEAAISLGVTVVAPAGNSGESGNVTPTLNTISTPGSAPSAITVGATTNAHSFYSTVRAGGQEFRALFGDGPRPDAALTAPLRLTPGLACDPLPAGSLEGAVALVRRGECSFTQKVINIQNAGARAVIIRQSAGAETPVEPLGLMTTVAPTVMVGSGAGGTLEGLAGQNAEVTIDPALVVVPETPHVMAPFSSRGPNIGTSGIKPELVAPGVGIYTATQKTYRESDMYHPSGYTAVDGTSFAAAMAAGAAAIVKQRNPDFTPAQIKSALVNTANPAVQDAGGQARVTSAGAGRLNAAAAASVGATVEPATLSFGVVTAQTSRTLRITNTTNATATFIVSGATAALTVSPASHTLNAGQTGDFTFTVANVAVPGSYEGAITIAGANTTLRVPYLYLRGNNTPSIIHSVVGGSFTGTIDDRDEWLLVMKVVDQFGVPVANTPVQFRAVSGGGAVVEADGTTDILGIAAAWVLLGPTPGEQVFSGTAGALTTEFAAFVRPIITISSGGVVNAASNALGPGIAPGSYVTVWGAGLSDSTKALASSSLPTSMAGVGVLFENWDQETVFGAPGGLSFVSPGQVNVQVPWEVAGQPAIDVTVVLEGVPSDFVNVPVSTYAPAPFEYPDPGANRQLVAALDQRNGLLTPANPARKGEVIQIYANGLGPVDPRPASGEPAPGAEPLSRTTTAPTVTIGGRNAPVSFSGLAPFFVGLYQVNATVPPDTPSGIQPLVISIGGVASRPVNIPVE